MSDTTPSAGSATPAAPDYGAMNGQQMLAAASSDPQAFEAAIAALGASETPPAAPETAAAPAAPETPAPETPAAAAPHAKAAPLTPDFERQLQQLQEGSAQQAQHNAQLQQQVAQLQAALLAAQTGQGADAPKPAALESEEVQIDPALFGDMSEEAIAQGLQKALAQQRQSLREMLRAEVKRELEKEIEPVAGQVKQQAANAHEAAILAKHPDAHESVASVQFRQWAQQLPGFSRAAVAQVLQEGTAAQVIDVLDTFKAAAQSAAPAAPAKAATPAVPASLSHVPGAAPATDPLAVLGSASDAALLAGASAMSNAQIEALLNASMRAAVH